MTIITLKRRLLAGQPSLGASTFPGSPVSAEMLSRSGFDWVMVDCQHGDWDDSRALSAFRSTGCALGCFL